MSLNPRSDVWPALVVSLIAAVAHAPAASAPAKDVIGSVEAVTPDERRLTVKSDDGTLTELAVAEGAAVLRTKPGATSLEGAAPSSLAEIAPGDRVLARGERPAEGPFVARRVVVMARAEIDRKQAAETDDWRRRGVSGTVTAVDAATGEISLRTGRAAGAPSITVVTAGRPVLFRRYAPDSVRFQDAQPSRLADVHVGDEARALGDRDETGAVRAEQVVSGSFRTISGTVSAVDSTENELVVKDDDSHQPLHVRLGPDSRLHRLPPEMALWLSHAANREAPGREGGGGEGGGRWAGHAGAGGGGRSPEELLARMPAATLADVKTGDRVLVSSTKGEDATRLRAIVVVTGLEALAPAPSGPRRARGLDVGLPAELLDLGMSAQ